MPSPLILNGRMTDFTNVVIRVCVVRCDAKYANSCCKKLIGRRADLGLIRIGTSGEVLL